jgi:hypothetical protein
MKIALIKLLVLMFGERHFWLASASPDGDSARYLVFIHRPKKNGFHGTNLHYWAAYVHDDFERWLNSKRIYPAY